MRHLNWKNVTGVSSNAGAYALKNAGSLFGAAFDKFSGIAENRQSDLEAQNKAKVINQIRQADTEASLQANAEALSPEALNERFGAGNINLAQIASAQEAQKSDIRGDIKYEQGQTDREKRLARADVLTNREDTRYNREQKAIADKAIASEALANVRTDQQTKAKIDETVSNNVREFNELNPSLPGQPPFAEISPSGEVVFNGNASGFAQEKFAALVEKNGGLPVYQSLQEKQATLAEAVKALPTELRLQTSKQLNEITNADTMSNQEKAFLTEKISTITTGAANETSLLDQTFKTRKARVKENQTKSDEELQTEYSGLLDFVNKKYPDTVLGSSFSGNLGGSELVDRLTKYRNEGITINGKTYSVEPELLKTAMNSSTEDSENENDKGFFDISVDEDKLDAYLRKFITKPGNKAAQKYLDSLNKTYLENKATIAATTGQKIKELKALYSTSLGAANKNVNLNLTQRLAKRNVNK